MPSIKHIELIEAVNNATTEREHNKAETYLHGFREGVASLGRDNDLCGCDMHYINQGIDRPMCAGVWLDWQERGEQ